MAVHLYLLGSYLRSWMRIAYILPDEYVYIWILSSIPFYVYLYHCYQNYLLFYEQVETAMEDGMISEEEDPCDTKLEQIQKLENPSYRSEMAEK